MLDVLAAKPAHARHFDESQELSRLHDLAAEHLDSSLLSSIPHPHTRWRTKVFSGEVHLPISSDKLRLTSPLWGEINLANLSNPKNYSGNVGYIRFVRDIAVLVGGGHVPGYPHTERKVQVHYGGSRNLIADWRKTLYLLKLAENDEFVSQFVGEGDGLDAFAERYFNSDRMKAKSFAINMYSAAIFGKLGWKTARTSRARTPYQDRHRVECEDHYGRILPWARNLHSYEPMLPINAFVQKLLHLDDDEQKRPMAVRVGPSILRFGKMYWSWRKAGVDTSELDKIFSQHGLGYHRAPSFYQEAVALARDGFSTEQLSRMAADRRMMDEPVKLAYSPHDHQILLEAFHNHGVETDELAPMLKENAPGYIGGRINEWKAMPRPRRSLFTHLGLSTLEYPGFIKWVRRYVGHSEAQIVEGEYKRAADRKRSDGQLSSSLEHRRPFELSANAVHRDNGSSLDVFEDLISDNDPPPDVVNRLEKAMRPLEDVKGALPEIELRRLRNIFSRELGTDVVDAALEKAGLSVG